MDTARQLRSDDDEVFGDRIKDGYEDRGAIASLEKVLRFATFPARGKAPPAPTPLVALSLSHIEIERAIELVHEAAETIREAEDRVRDGEARAHAISLRAAAEMKSADGRIQAAETRARAAEARCQDLEGRLKETEGWLGEIFATITEELPSRT